MSLPSSIFLSSIIAGSWKATEAYRSPPGGRVNPKLEGQGPVTPCRRRKADEANMGKMIAAETIVTMTMAVNIIMPKRCSKIPSERTLEYRAMVKNNIAIGEQMPSAGSKE